jgi:hypothetical protein
MIEVIDPGEPTRVVPYVQPAVTPDFSDKGFYPRFLERDEAEREPPCDKYPWDSVRNVRPFSRLQAQ